MLYIRWDDEAGDSELFAMMKPGVADSFIFFIHRLLLKIERLLDRC